MSDENVALVYRWFEEVWNKGRAEAIDEMFAANGIAHGLGETGVDVEGPAGFKPFFEKLRGAFPKFQVTIEDTIAADDKVAARWTVRVTHEGDQLGIPATGRQATVSGMSIVRISDGQIVEAWNNWDILGLMEQIGAMQPAATLLE
ncbi:MAG: ester cyclase [Pyrinomonadaceae bacterium]|nr:ester cyclase [Pyrinomonadaceae bacterium]